MTVALNEAVTDFSGVATSDTDFNLADFKNEKHLVIYFYPKDSTPGCTIEGQNFRDLHEEFLANDTVIFGVSRDTLRKHENFKAKYSFPFELISDEDESICNLFAVIKQKSMFGKKYMGIERSTFIINKAGVLAHEWRKVKVKNHAAEVLKVIKSQ
jgi:peroxiredoxin Q/BCP